VARVHFDDSGHTVGRREWDTNSVREPGSFRFCSVLNAMAANGEFDAWDECPRGEVLALHRCEEWLFRLQLLP